MPQLTPSDHHSPLPSGYQVNAESAAEMARLTRQAHMLTEHLGLLPEAIDLATKPLVLDVGCGPGEWALRVAEHFPASHVTGIDISTLMIRYARFSAEAHHCSNVQFQVMDARQSLAFPDASFDVIHARFITGFQSTTTWPILLRECFRLLRPGGILCHTEFEDLGVTTSLHLTRYNRLVIQAARAAGQCFTLEGNQYGITAVLARLLQQAGCAHVQRQAFVLDYSAGMPAHASMYENFSTFLKLLQPFLIRQGVTTQQEVETLYELCLQEIQTDDFCAIAYFQRIWAEKSV